MTGGRVRVSLIGSIYFVKRKGPWGVTVFDRDESGAIAGLGHKLCPVRKV